ncbi:hypothetical protein HY745_10235 [Candidatus Desantisbacteria bacterium]|nr:hypothetical protein [Candidatus Desantisbacteria bacterium]
MSERLIIKTFRKQDFSASFPWMQFCEEIGVDHVAPSINIAILKDECSSN